MQYKIRCKNCGKEILSKFDNPMEAGLPTECQCSGRDYEVTTVKGQDKPKLPDRLRLADFAKRPYFYLNLIATSSTKSVVLYSRGYPVFKLSIAMLQ